MITIFQKEKPLKNNKIDVTGDKTLVLGLALYSLTNLNALLNANCKCPCQHVVFNQNTK